MLKQEHVACPLPALFLRYHPIQQAIQQAIQQRPRIQQPESFEVAEQL